jgi:hypothetical protein
MSVIKSDAYTLGEIDGAHADLNTTTLQKNAFKKPLFGSLTVCSPISAVKKVGDLYHLTVEKP